MNSPVDSGMTSRFLSKWTRTTVRFKWPVLCLFLCITSGTTWYMSSHLGIITDTAGMLSPELRYLQVYRAYKKAFPQSTDTIVAVIDGMTPDIAMDARDRLASALAEIPKRFRTVYAPGSEPFFKKNGLLYLSTQELERLSERMAEAQPLLGTLAREPNLKGLFSILKEAETRSGSRELLPLYQQISQAAEALLQDKFYQVSWLEVMHGGTRGMPGADRRQFVIVQPVIDYSTVLPGREAMELIHQTATALGLDAAHGVRVRLTGDIAMEYEELASVTKGAKLAGWLSLFMVAIVLFTGLRSPKMVFATLATLITGLLWTAGFAAAAIGHLNMISVAFAVLFIGLGVDYSIHYCLRFNELLHYGLDAETALQKTSQDTGRSLVLCAVTTSIGFFAFVPTDYSGVGELGLISGTGMFIGLFLNLTMLPALLAVLKIRPWGKTPPAGETEEKVTALSSLAALPFRHSRPILLGAAIVGAASLAILPRITYDWNPLNLRDQSCVSVSTFKELLACGDNSPWSLKIVEKPGAGLEEKIKKLRKLPEVDKVVDIESFVPGNQDEKADIIEEMDFILGPVFLEKTAPPPDFAQKKAAISQFISVLKKERGTGRDEAVSRLEQSLERFLGLLRSLPEAEARDRVETLEHALLASLPPRLHDLRLSLQAEPFSISDIPPDIKARWVSRQNHWRVEVFPWHNLNSRPAMIQFINAVRNIAPDATGYPVLIWEGGKVVSSAFKQAFAMSITAIFILLLALMPRKLDAMMVMIPLLLAGVMTGAAMELAGISLNFANIIALPLILGIGVDNGIHMVHRFRTMSRARSGIFATSTTRGIIFSTLTTICSFGNLAVSPHEGMASMGKLLALGVGITLLCTMLLLPALFNAMTRAASVEPHH